MSSVACPCGAWTEGRNAKLCAACRAPKIILIECAEPECNAKIKKSGATAYCMAHRDRKASKRKTGVPPKPP